MQDSPYHTTDFWLAAVLVSLGYDIKIKKQENTTKCTFFFNPTDQLRNSVKKYWAEALLVEPIKLAHSHRYLKNRMISGAYD